MVMTLLTRPKKTVATVVIATDGSGDYNTDGTDDDVQIQAAIDSLPATGGCIYMKEGTYTITTAITITTNNVSIIGCGRSTIVTTNDDITIFDINGAIGVLIQKIYIYGAGVGTPTNFGMYFRGGSTFHIVNECWVENCGSVVAALFVSSNNSIITNCYVVGNVDAGIRVLANNYRIISNHVEGGGDNGIEIEGNNGIISNNTLEDNDGGIVIRGNGILIMNNVIRDDNSGGIILSAPEGDENNDCIVDGNYVSDSVQHGIRLIFTDNSVVSNNTCEGNDSGNTQTYSGIQLESSDNNVIQGNRCRENDNYEIDISNSGCANNLVEGNHCIGVDHEGTINDVGTNTQIFNNVES